MERLSTLIVGFRRPARRGVVLMVMLALLGLFTVIAVTFVVASGQFRRGARAASRVEQDGGDSFESMLQQAIMQVVRGTNHPHSVLGPHSLLEDMYGNSDAVAGCLLSYNAAKAEPPHTQGIPVSVALQFRALNYGWDRKPGAAYVDDDGNGVVDDVKDSTEAQPKGDDTLFGSSLAHPLTTGDLSKTPPVIDSVVNYYAGRVITFINGAAAGQSCYIIQSGGSNGMLTFTPPENGTTPKVSDRFVINGRPFSGTGFGFSPFTSINPDGTPLMPAKTATISINGNVVPNPTLRQLDFPYYNGVSRVDGTPDTAVGWPIALFPNPVDPGYRDYLTRYDAIVEADEDYDAPDEQNMLLAYRQWNEATGKYETVAPSLHRPDLINYVMHKTKEELSDPYSSMPLNTKPQPYDKPWMWYGMTPALRRHVILRPEPADHYDYTQENVVDPRYSDGWTPGEPFIDQNGNGQWDPAYTHYDPVSKTMVGVNAELYTDQNSNGSYDVGDRTYANSGFDPFQGPWDVDNDNDGSPDSIWVDLGLPPVTAADGRLIKPLFAILCVDLDGRVNVNAHGSPMQYGVAGQEVIQGLGVSLATLQSTAAVAGFPAPSDNVPAVTYYDVGARSDANGNPVPVSGHNNPKGTTEERYFVGPYAVAYNNNSSDLTRNPIIASSYPFGYQLFGPYSTTGVMSGTSALTYRWATHYADQNGTRLDYPGGNIPEPSLEPAFGMSGSPADVNLAGYLMSHEWLPHYDPFGNNARGNWYRTLLEGSPPTTSDSIGASGRYGESHLLRYSCYPGLGIVPRAGATRTLVGNQTIPQPPFDQSSSAAYYGGDDNLPASPSSTTYVGNTERDAYMQTRGDYGTPGDHDANGAVGLDILGQPIYYAMGGPQETYDEPTEINLNRRYFAQMKLTGHTTYGGGYNAFIDAPYTPAELERILRRDPSGSLPTRLYSNLGGGVSSTSATPIAITTESWDIPCPHVAPTAELAAVMRANNFPLNNPTIGDLVRARYMLCNQGTPPSNAVLNSMLGTYGNASSRLLSPDLLMGLRMNVNSPFGNGYDDNNNNVVDEPGESPAEFGGFDSHGAKMPFDGNRDGNTVSPAATASTLAYNSDADPEKTRQQFAKELYCLMMLLIDQNYVAPLPLAGLPPGVISVDPTKIIDTNAGSNFASPHPESFPDDTSMPTLFPWLNGQQRGIKTRRWLAARQIAQWAINVVDFRDRDSIMTSFEFDADPYTDNDTNPGNGTWDVDGKLTIGLVGDENQPWRGVVWGCEYPELLLTETFACHDRRTQNTDYDNNTVATGSDKLCQAGAAGLVTNATPTNDHTWDQARIPQGSAFVELYATANPKSPYQPPELYSNLSKSTSILSSIPRLALAQAVGGNPVWRLAITEGRVSSRTNAGSGIPDAHPNNDVALQLAIHPSTCSLDPNDRGFSLLPWVNAAAVTTSQVRIERVVTFCTAASGVNAVPEKAVTGTAGPFGAADVYGQGVGGGNDTIIPGEYIVVGPYRNATSTPAGTSNITMFGRTSKTDIIVTAGNTTTTLAGGVPSPLAMMGRGGSNNSGGTILFTNVGGREEYPMYGQFHNKNVTSSNAILDGKLGTLVSSGGNTVNYEQIRQPNTVACVLWDGPGIVSSAGPGGEPVGFNISEPNLADRPTSVSTTCVPYRRTASLVNSSEPWNGGLVTRDTLTSGSMSIPGVDDPVRTVDDLPWDGYLDDANNPIVRNSELDYFQDHTTLRYKSVFLQRLADPTRPWHVTDNPYLTIDWMPFDLTVFNGEAWSAEAKDPKVKNPATVAHLREPGNIRDCNSYTNPPNDPNAANRVEALRVRFASRQRGAPARPFRNNFSYMNLWSQPNWLDEYPFSDMTTLPPPTKSVATATNDPYNTHFYDYNSGASSTTLTFRAKWQDPLQHSLGYINQPYQYRMAPLSGTNTTLPLVDYTADVRTPVARPVRAQAGDPLLSGAAPNLSQLGWITEIDLRDPSGAQLYQTTPGHYDYYYYLGSPWRPFNWLTWNNRPFLSALEMMIVPHSSPARLLSEFDMRRTALPSAPVPAPPTPAGIAGNRLAPWEMTRSGNHYTPYMTAIPFTPHMLNATVTGAATGVPMAPPGFASSPPFKHLLNFFESSNGTASGPTSTFVDNQWPPPATPPSGWQPHFYAPGNLYRLFEYVNVPTKFAGLAKPVLSSTSPWPFTAPNNSISAYREPGRVNMNTIPLLPTRSIAPDSAPDGKKYYMDEGANDGGAGVWRSVVNEFHPRLRWFQKSNVGGGMVQYNQGDTPAARYLRAGDLTVNFNPSANNYPSSAHKFQVYPWNPSENASVNFKKWWAGMQSEGITNPNRALPPLMANLRYGESGNYGGAFSANNSPINQLGSQRFDPRCPSLFINPFRSYSEDYSAVPSLPTMMNIASPLASTVCSAYTLSDRNLPPSVPPAPFLAVDSTLLRRKDTTWTPWLNTSPLGPMLQAGDTPAQIDPAYDPMFALSYPTAFQPNNIVGYQAPGAKPLGGTFSGYTNSMFYTAAYRAAGDPMGQMNMSIGSGATVPSYYRLPDGNSHSRDTDYRNSDRNPFFRYQLYSKLGSIATTRSNVYAIWITVGFFEVERVDPSTPPLPSQQGGGLPNYCQHTKEEDFPTPYRFPTGFRILREMGSGTGETKRHQMFAIFDRSIPVGFLRGENLNVDKAFLIRRIVY